MAWPRWPSHQSPLTAWPRGQLNFPTAEWSLRSTALINARGCCCSCELAAPHISRALKSLQFRHTARDKGKEMRRKEKSGEEKRKGFIGKKPNQCGAQSQTSHVCTLTLLPSNLRQKWERTGREEEKQIRWRLLETSAAALISLRLSLSHLVWDNVDKKLWMQSSHVLRVCNSEVLVWQRG